MIYDFMIWLYMYLVLAFLFFYQVSWFPPVSWYKESCDAIEVNPVTIFAAASCHFQACPNRTFPWNYAEVYPMYMHAISKKKNNKIKWRKKECQKKNPKHPPPQFLFYYCFIMQVLLISLNKNNLYITLTVIMTYRPLNLTISINYLRVYS